MPRSWGCGNNIIVGGPGNDQIFAGTGSDTLIGGPGADYFNCGTQTSTGGSSSSAVILDFNPGEGDTKASNCKYVFTVGGAPSAPWITVYVCISWNSDSDILLVPSLSGAGFGNSSAVDIGALLLLLCARLDEAEEEMF
jgi:hypothetical protein